MSLAIAVIPIGIIGGIQGYHSESVFLIGLIFIVTFTVSFVIAYFIKKPIERLTKNIDQISKGKLDVILEDSEIYEINNLTESLNRIMASLKLAIHKVGVKKGEIFEDAVKTKESYEKKQQDLLNGINGWAWETDAKGTFTFVSKNVSKLLGYKAEELLGNSFYDYISPEDVKKVKQALSQAEKEKKPIFRVKNWNIAKNGEKICVLTNGVPFYDKDENIQGFRGVDTDISAEKEAEARIKELNNELSDLKMDLTELLNIREKKKTLSSLIKTDKKSIDEKWSEHEFDSVFIFDENANILDCNDQMYKKLGYTKSEFLNLNMADIDALESKKDILIKIKKVKKDGVVTLKTIHKRKDGSAILVDENLQYLKDKKEFKGIVRDDYPLKKSK
jgi:PAS domain S-box-containing protein